MRLTKIISVLALLNITLPFGSWAQEWVAGDGPKQYVPLKDQQQTLEQENASLKRKTPLLSDLTASVAASHHVLYSGANVSAHAVAVSTSTPVFPAIDYVYDTREGNIHIKIIDDGYQLSSDELRQVEMLLSQLPLDHVKNIKELVMRPEIAGEFGYVKVENNGTRLSFSLFRNPNNKDASSVKVDVISAIGEYVYNEVLSDKDRLDYSSFLTFDQNTHAAGNFSAYYYNSLTDIVSGILGAVEVATPGKAREFAKRYGLDPDTYQARPDILQSYLASASWYVNPFGALRQFNSDGTVTFIGAYRDDKTVGGSTILTIGTAHFVVENNKIIAQIEDGIYQQATKSSDSIYLLSYGIWDKPVDLPASILNRFPPRTTPTK